MGWRDEYKEHKCPDGTKRLVLKKMTDIGRIFSLYVPEVDYKFKTSLKVAQDTVEAAGEGDFQKKAEQLLDNIDKSHIDAVNKFIMSYTLYCTNPCDPNAYNNFQKAVSDIQKSLNTVRKLSDGMESIEKAHKQLGGSGDIDTSNINVLISSLEAYYRY